MNGGGGGGPSPSPLLGSGISSDKRTQTHHSDWYSEWSQAATRRRHLDRLEDDDEAAAAAAARVVVILVAVVV